MGRNNFDDDDFNFDDDFSFDDDSGDELRSGVGGETDDLGDFTFDDDLGTTDDFEDIELGDEGGDFTFDEDDDLAADDETPGGRTNRTFILLAALMIILFVAGLVAVIFLASRPNPQDVAFAQTSTAVKETNDFTQRQFEATQTAAVIFGTQQAETIQAEGTRVAATQTADAAFPIATFTTDANLLAGPDPVFPQVGTVSAGEQAEILAINPQGTFYRVRSLTTGLEGWVSAAAVTTTGNLGRLPVEDVPTPEILQTPTLNPTDLAGTAIAQAGSITPVVTIPPVSTVSDLAAVQLTATALAAIFNTTPTAEPGITTPIGGGGNPTALPDTGLIDDIIAGGNAGFLTLLLISIGLVGLIVASRWLRAANR